MAFRRNRRRGIGSVVLRDWGLVHGTVEDRAVEDWTIEDRSVMDGCVMLDVLSCLHTFGLFWWYWYYFHFIVPVGGFWLDGSIIGSGEGRVFVPDRIVKVGIDTIGFAVDETAEVLPKGAQGFWSVGHGRNREG